MSKQTSICLTMMVKNEAHIIERCLKSVTGIVDYWVICDTGSTDGTQEIIQNYFDKKNIPGELFQHTWKNYGHNRTLTLECAKNKGDYLLLADADYIFHIKDSNFKNTLTGIAYQFYNITLPLKYTMLKLLKGNETWQYIGATHEYIKCTSNLNHTTDIITSFHVEELCDGGNRDSKFENDIRILTESLKEEPNNSRSMFYLARSYEDTDQYEKAIEYYLQRIDAGGWEEEVYYSYFCIARCNIKLQKPFGEIAESAFKAFEYRPSRLEAIYELIVYCRTNQKYQTGYLLGKGLVDSNPLENDKLFIHIAVYEWMLKDEVSICAYHSGNYEESYKLCKEILQLPQVSDDHRERIEKNAQFSAGQLKATSDSK